MTSHFASSESSHSSFIAYDKELWDLYVSNMAQTPCTGIPDIEKRKILDKILAISRGSRTEAFKYIEHCKLASCPDAVQICSQCPKENIPIKAVEFDNIKVFYHPTWPDHLRPVGNWNTWNFYIGRPGAPARQCIDWASEGIKIDACGPSGEWGECIGLLATPCARVRITYPFGYEQRTREIVFPSNDPSVPTIYLEHM